LSVMVKLLLRSAELEVTATLEPLGTDEDLWLQADGRLEHAPYVAAHRKAHRYVCSEVGAAFRTALMRPGSWLGVRRATGIPVARARDSAPRRAAVPLALCRPTSAG
jgi:hypothetical protein